MKAILVIDMPNDCLACPFLDDICFPKRKFEKGFPFDERPKECPLKPMPEMKDADVLAEFTVSRIFNTGWNACIKAIITGETE